MPAAPPIYGDGQLYSTTPPNNRVLSGEPGMLEIVGRMKVPDGTIGAGKILGLSEAGTLVKAAGEPEGTITGGALAVGGVLATASNFTTLIDGWQVSDTGTLGSGSFGGANGTFIVTQISAGLLTASNISGATGAGFNNVSTYTVSPGGATVTLTLSAPTTITAITVVTPGGGYAVGTPCTVTDNTLGISFTFLCASASSDIVAATVAGGTNYSVGDVLPMTSVGGSSALLTVATLVPDDTGLGYTVATYDLVDSGSGNGATLNVTLVDGQGCIRGSSLVAAGTGYTASSSVDVGTLVAPVTKLAKFLITTTSGGGGGGAGVDPVERQIANTGANAITAACIFTGPCGFDNVLNTFAGVATGTPAAGGALSLDANNVLVKSTAPSPGAGVDPVERLAANPNTVAAGNPVAAACDFEGQCNFIAANTQGPTGPFIKAGRRIDLYDPDTTQYPGDQAVIQYSALTRGQGTGFPGLREGLSFYSGATSGRNISMHLTDESQNKPVCVLSRDNDETEMVVKSFGTNDVSIFTVKATNDFTAAPAVDHCVINMTSQTADPVGGNPATGVNTCSLKYVPVNGDVTAGTLSIDRGVQALVSLGIGNPADAAPLVVTQTESTSAWTNLTLASGFTQHASDTAQYQITTFVKLVNGAVNETFQRVDFRGIAVITTQIPAGGANVFLFSAQTPVLPTLVRRHIVKVLYYVPTNTNTNSSSGVNMPISMFYRDVGGGVLAGKVNETGAVIGVDPTVAGGTNNQILDAGYGTVGSEFVLDNTYYYSN